MPPEVEEAVDKRASMTAIGNLKIHTRREVSDGSRARIGESGGAGPAGTAAELAVGFGLAQQMMQQGLSGGAATPTVSALPGKADWTPPKRWA